jgi:NAD-dependent deacetylase
MNQILFFTGAGLSAESGISTFRDNEDGLWTKYNPAIVATLANLDKNRKLVFDFYNERRVQLPDLQPNAAHIGIAEIQKKYGKHRVRIFTQNIDDLLERAGCEDVVHVHGKFTDHQCLYCDHVWDVGYTSVPEDVECPKCQSTDTKPGVVFFGETAPEYSTLFNTFRRSQGDIIVVMGTSGEVISMNMIVTDRWSKNKSYAILNNKDYDGRWIIDYDLFDERIFLPATEGIEEIKKVIEEKFK